MPLDALLGTWAITMHHSQMTEPVQGQQRFERVLDDAFFLLHWTYEHPDFPDALAVLDDTSMHYFDVRGVTRTFDLTIDDAKWTIVRRDSDFWQRATTRLVGPDAMHGVGENSHDQGHTWEHDFALDYRRLA